ncbi:hypothetical protein EUX98_g7993 [Antrodiella citrinella]|uniref:non-specific serine/threonine protein kinase n=1 Tax=Antrodiella citrinella TaxID=2447956 RepID=A0A4S4MCH4_9APHY|nr:hypothetical protein EUX98_g7993 [Antrodiella citrinella]
MCELAEHMCNYVLLRRLHEGPQPAWEDTYSQLQQIYQRPLAESPSYAEVQAVVSAFHTREWIEDDSELRNLGSVYLRGLVPHMDESNLHDLKEALSNGVAEADELLPLVDQRLEFLDSMYADGKDQAKVQRPSWRSRVKTIVQAIVEPDEISWTDDNDSLSDSQYIARALTEVESRCDRGMKNENRGVRLSAGRALAELVRLYQAIDGASAIRTESLFKNLLRICDSPDSQLTETALITAGYIGKVATSEVLYRVISCLISYMGHTNLVVKGSANMQLLAIAKHHKKQPYSLLSPYMSQIAPKLVARLPTQPMVLAEVSRIICLAPNVFISLTIHHTLPQVFANRDHKALEAMSKELGQKPSTMFLNAAPSILAHAFLLPPGQTNSVLTFVVDVLREASNGAAIDISSVVKSCLMNLLAELVIVMGQEDDYAVDRATQALLKVDSALNDVRSQARARTSSERGVPAMLKGQMLGILTHLNDLLRDVKGKKASENKKQIIRSLGPFVLQVGPAVSNVAPQLMATMQTMIAVPEFAEVTLSSWLTFLMTLDLRDLGAQVGPSSASFVGYWHTFSSNACEIAKRCLDYIVVEKGQQLGDHMDDLVDLGTIPQLAATHQHLVNLRRTWTPAFKLGKLLERAASDNITVALRSLEELKTFMSSNDVFLGTLASGDMFDPLVASILGTLLAAACRDTEGIEPLRRLAFDCIGILGAVDPDRFELNTGESKMIMLSNFTDENESVAFALHMMSDVLVSAFRSTSDIAHQSHLAYVLQELLRFCKFQGTLVNPGAGGGSVPLKVRNRWNGLPKHVVETVTPLLDARYSLQVRAASNIQHPIYCQSSIPTYREWIQSWAEYLIGQTSHHAKTIFVHFMSVVRNKDVGVAHHLLPHLVLNVLISGDMTAAQNIRSELLAVLEDQVNPESTSTFDKKDLSAQTVFILMDHLNKWVRVMRQDINAKRSESKRNRANVTSEAEEQLLRIDSILTSIDQSLMAKAALQCKAYGRALMSFEQQILSLRSNGVTGELQNYYERLHEIYSYLDEPDGMEGVSTMILSPSLEHQIRQHESTGKWTSAQSCWEVRLQHTPDDLQSHLGLLRCLRNLGHYDTMRTHVKGVLTRKPVWEADLTGYQIESGWIVGDWDEVQELVTHTKASSASVMLAGILLAMRTGDDSAISESLSRARQTLGAPIAAAGPRGYRRAYDAVVNLHMVHELELIHHITSGGNIPANDLRLSALLHQLSTRLSSTLPAFRIRESVLSMRRTGFGLHQIHSEPAREMVSRSWLLSAKLARKAGYWQTAYSAVLHARHTNHPFSFVESAKLVKSSGEPLRALQELNNSLKSSEMVGRHNTDMQRAHSKVIDLTTEDATDEMKQMKAKALVLRARWMNESDRYASNTVLKAFQDAAGLFQRWESGWFHLGQFHDECFKGLLPADQLVRGIRMNHNTIKCYGKSIRYGSKYIYQTVPRLLTLWLDLGEVKDIKDNNIFKKINEEVDKAITNWYTAFPQIVSRVGHGNRNVYSMLAKLIQNVIGEYPKQALWLFASVVKSTKQTRRERGMSILNKLKASHHANVEILLTLMAEFYDEIEVMKSLARPRKITIQGSNGQKYMFLGKPKDDLRKDARLMDFNAIINKLLKSNSESRRRQLHIRTYGVVTLNEECGFIQWVPNTVPLRPLLLKSYDARNIVTRHISHELSVVLAKIKEADMPTAAKLFVEGVLPSYPPVFHEWFIETFPEPSAWLASRLTYSRTAAVMSMVGFILGLGDRHTENILLDTVTGDTVHVDFNCLFDKAKTMEVPERVPFRLTQNIVDGLGLTGPEGFFRIACEVTMQLLRDNKDSLMSVLDAFVHDPLVEWEDQKRRLEREAQRRNTEKSVDERKLAKNALYPIENKLKGIYNNSLEKPAREIPTSTLVQILIQEATDPGNLGKMYPGWAAWY